MPRKARHADNPESPVQSRHIRALPRLILFVRAGGRCEFDGCNDYLIEDALTLTAGNFAQVAHVVGFREQGPRGNNTQRPDNIHDLDNLMLLCPKHHKLIDDNPRTFTKAALQEYKRTHEDRIRHLTDLGAERKTSVLVLKSRIAGQPVSIPFSHIVEATSPNFPVTKYPTEIDLNGLASDAPGFLNTACETINQSVALLFSPQGEATRAGQVSVFALGAIPVLIHLGRQLTTKFPVDVFQRHRDTERWTWKADGPPIRYSSRVIKIGRRDAVAIVLALSGSVHLNTLPETVLDTSTIYEMTLDGTVPDPTFLRTRADLENFRVAYQQLLGLILKEHGTLETVDLFPAVPAPIAVLCGRELLPKVHPRLRVFDNDRERGGFTYQLTV